MNKEDKEFQNAEQPCSREDDEINLSDYCLVLWKRKTFILLSAVLPAVCVAALLWFLPQRLTATSIYDVSELGISEKQYHLLLNRFYSDENLARLAGQLRKSGLEPYADLLCGTRYPEKLITLDAIPAFVDSSKSKTVDAEQLIKLRDITASLLKVTVGGSPAEILDKASLVIQANIQDVILLYMAREQLTAAVREYNRMLAEIESNRFGLDLELKSTKEMLASMKKVDLGGFDVNQTVVVAQPDNGQQHQYLTLGYQIQAAESKRIALEETIKTNQEKYGHYKELVELNKMVLAELDAKMPCGYTNEQFTAFLTELLNRTEKPQLKDYLSSYARTIENKISANRPVIEKPKIASVSKNMVKKTSAVFAACLMLSVFAAFLIEGVKQNKTQVS